MKIAVLSGKGGTGKTFISVNLAAATPKSIYIDCDVEGPNGHLFFKPEELTNKDVLVKVPYVNPELCDGCRKCVDFCKFNALAYIREKLIIFDDICHSCGGCILLCPQGALLGKDKIIGSIEKGVSDNVTVITGILIPGEPSGVPIIKELMEDSSTNSGLSIIDCPPGSSCMVMESIQDADYCILVAEPTIFGVHNLNMVYDLVRLFKKPLGVILNKSLDEENPAEEFCMENDIKILGKIHFDTELGIINSNGLIAIKENEKYKELFLDLVNKVTKEVENETITNP